MLSKKFASAERKNCVACGTCLSVCPKQAIEIIKGCYAHIDETSCVGCGKCSKACPANCISIETREKERADR